MSSSIGALHIVLLVRGFFEIKKKKNGQFQSVFQFKRKEHRCSMEFVNLNVHNMSIIQRNLPPHSLFRWNKTYRQKAFPLWEKQKFIVLCSHI